MESSTDNKIPIVPLKVFKCRVKDKIFANSFKIYQLVIEKFELFNKLKL